MTPGLFPKPPATVRNPRRIFWLKTRDGWRETPQEHRIDLRDARDLRHLTNAELEQIILEADPAFRRRPALPKPDS